MLRQAAAPAGLVAAAIVVAVIWGGTTAGRAVALALVGIAGVLAVSLVFLAVGRSEDAERAAASRPPPEPDPPAGAGPPHHPERPALSRRRPLPPRRPQ